MNGASANSRDAAAACVAVVDISSSARWQQHHQQPTDERHLAAGCRRQSMTYAPCQQSTMTIQASREVNVPREGFWETLDKTTDRVAETSKYVILFSGVRKTMPAFAK